MMYQDKIVVALKVGGKVLRESNGSVFIPFGSQYTILVKNMNSVRALVRIEIDGTDATEGTSLIVGANESVELERFIKDGNFSKGQCFKFIERSAKIEAGPRGIKAEDGLIRVEVEFEREPAKIVSRPYQQIWGYDSLARGVSYSSTDLSATAYSKGVLRGSSASITPDMSMSVSADACTTSVAASTTMNDNGITVGGSMSNQEFVLGAWFPTDGLRHVLVLKVLGEVNEVLIQKPITVKTKIQCPTCGTKAKAGSKFCAECGTGLEIA